MDGPEIVLDVGCVNPDCGRYGVKGLGNIVIRRRYGTSDIRFLHCRHCQHEFSELDDCQATKHFSEGARVEAVIRESLGRLALPR
ncbi:MAG: hypothetical protein HQL63_01055 [Magnetococcales bacterium]|nr:hypothetical protein [Magnetococcales bacterium]